MATTRPRFSIRTALAATYCFAIVFASAWIPGGYFVFAPLGVVSLLGVIVLRLTIHWGRSSDKFALRRQWRLLGAATCLIISVAAYFPFLGIAVASFREHQRAAVQRDRIVRLRNPEQVRDAAVALHAKLSALPLHDRMLEGDSMKVPDAIAKLHPLTVEARESHLFIKMSQNRGGFFGVLAYPDPVDVQHGDTEIIDRLWYWETP